MLSNDFGEWEQHNEAEQSRKEAFEAGKKWQADEFMRAMGEFTCGNCGLEHSEWVNAVNCCQGRGRPKGPVPDKCQSCSVPIEICREAILGEPCSKDVKKEV